MNLRRIVSIWVFCVAVAFSEGKGVRVIFSQGHSSKNDSDPFSFLAPSSGLREQWILEAPENPKFKIYIVADPLFSLLTLTQTGETKSGLGLTVPHPGSSRALESSKEGREVLDGVKLASELNLGGASDFYDLLKKGDAIFFVASFILSPKEVLLAGKSSRLLEKVTEEELVFTQVWHERLHLAVDRLRSSDPALWEGIKKALAKSHNILIVVFRRKIRRFYTDPLEEIFCYFFTGMHKVPKIYNWVLERTFKGEVLRAVKGLLKESMPTEQEIEVMREIAHNLQPYISLPNHYDQIRQLMREAREARELSVSL